MNMRFIPVTEMTAPLNLAIGISGASGTGKTYTALLMARGIAEEMTGRKGAPIGYIDTENRRALHYKQAFPEMLHLDFKATDDQGSMLGFGPERWIEAIDAADAAGLPVVILDSLSHSWEGVGGILDLQAEELDRLTSEAEAKAGGRYAVDPAKFSEQAWIKPKARYRRLVDRIVRARTNIIICNRAKPVRQAGFGEKAKNARQTKLRRDDVPWDISGDAAMIFEMVVSVILDPSAPGCPVHQIKVADQFKSLLDPRHPMNSETGRQMAEWAKGQGEAQKRKELLDAARTAARAGTASFADWWRKADQDERRIANTIIDDLKATCAEADRMDGALGDDPFAATGAGSDEDDLVPDASTDSSDATDTKADAAEIEAAYMRGRAAGQQGRTAQGCPAGLKDVPALQAAWLRGWKEEAAPEADAASA